MPDMPETTGPEESYYAQKQQEEQPGEEIRHTLPPGLYPILITVLYLLLGFICHAWHPGWLIFLTVPLYYWQPKSKLLRWCNPVFITLLYLVLGFYFHLWHPGWMIFFAIPIAYIVDGSQKSRQRKAEEQ